MQTSLLNQQIPAPLVQQPLSLKLPQIASKLVPSSTPEADFIKEQRLKALSSASKTKPSIETTTKLPDLA